MPESSMPIRAGLLTLKMTPSFIRAHGTGCALRGQLPSPPARCPVPEQSFRPRYGPQLRRHETSDPHPMTAHTVFVLQCEDCGRLPSTMRASSCPWLASRPGLNRYIDARPHRQDRRNLLHRTAGPYIHARRVRTMSAAPPTAPELCITAILREVPGSDIVPVLSMCMRGGITFSQSRGGTCRSTAVHLRRWPSAGPTV